MEQYYTFGDVNRHPQGRVVSIAYYALLRLGGDKVVKPIEQLCEASAYWRNVKDLPRLAFDHQQIFDKGLEKIKRSVSNTSLLLLSCCLRNLRLPSFRMYMKSF
jgi:8-oxo-dGTP diphosphatase